MAHHRFLFLDGHHLIYRGHASFPTMATSNGFPTGAVTGFIRMTWKLMDHFNPTQTVLFMDSATSRKTNQAILPNYKAHRKPSNILPKEKALVEQLATHLGIPVISRPNVEADDLMASGVTTVQRLYEPGTVVVALATSDKDLAQCVAPNVVQLTSRSGQAAWELRTEKEIFAKYGVHPHQMAEYLALVGDTADNIEGIKGVGTRTAAKWLASYGSIPGILQNIDSLEPARLRIHVRENVERLQRNLEVTTLDRFIALEELERVKDHPPPVHLSLAADLMESLEMKATRALLLRRYEGLV